MKMYSIKKYTTHFFIILCVYSLLAAFTFQNPITKFNLIGSIEQDTLAKHFKNPPAQYSIIPFWSLNNSLDSTKMNWQMDQMLDKGVYGAFLHAREGLDQSTTPYFSVGWWTAIESTVKHAHEKGFYTYLYDEDKWPSGSAGGRTVLANPERNTKKIMRYNDFQVMGPQTIQLNFSENPYAIYAGKISDRGVYDFSSQIDLTNLAGKEWKMPAGRWSIISFRMIKDPNQQINYMDSATVADFIHITHDAYYKRLGPYFGNTIPGVFFDEIYANSSDRKNNIFWSDDFTEQFKKIKGYDIKSFLPLLILNDPSLSAEKRFDFFDVVRIVYGNAWFKQYAKWASDHHIWVTGHTTEELIQHIRQSDYFYTEGQLQVPCTDNEDFRYGFPRSIDFYNPKQISSLGHNYGSTRMSAEAMGSGGYTIPLEEYRYGFSMLGVYGVNLFIPHLFHYSMDRPENQNDWPPSWFYQNPYWKYFKPLANYAQRISYMIAQGKHVAKVAIVYPLTQVWLGGYTAPISDELYREVQQQLLDNHIDYDVIDPYTLSNAKSNKNGLLVGNEQYQALVLPGLKAIQTACLNKINDFVLNGGVVVGINELPTNSEKGTPIDPFVVGSMQKIFGFQPRELLQIQYHTINDSHDNRILIHSVPGGGKGIFSRYTEDLTTILRKQLSADITIEGEGNEAIKYQHRKIATKDIFYLVNSHKQTSSFTVNLSTIGKPSLWNPETGNIVAITNYRIHENQLQLQLSFKPWESYFIVVDPAETSNKNQLLVTKTDLDNLEINTSNNQLIANGWGKGNGMHELNYLNGTEKQTIKWRSDKALKELTLKGNWDFQLCPTALNYSWNNLVKFDTISLPIMNFQSEFNNIEKQVKIEDKYSGIKGASRYLSVWDADWISYYDNSMHLSEMGGGTIYFKKEFSINSSIKNAFIDITADNSFELTINGKLVGKYSNWKNTMHYSISEFIQQGPNTIQVTTTNTKGLLLQGLVNLTNEKSVTIKTDTTWLAKKQETNWIPAICYASPPMGFWGQIKRPDYAVHFPCKTSYQQVLPPGVEAVLYPNILGDYEMYINNQLVVLNKGIPTPIKQYLRSEKNILSISVVLHSSSDGIQSPIQLICGKASVGLKPWSDMHLDWYSGRAIYTNTIDVDAAYCKANNKLMLDLGQVNHFAEIWVNNQLVEYRSWAPFTADVSKYVHPGKNSISIVVTNLLANEATWNMMDANIDAKEARWWNYGSILREKEKLVSGLLGPVKIIPYVRESIKLKM